MTYQEIEKTAIVLYGTKWRPSLAHDLGLKLQAIRNWEVQGVPKHAVDLMKNLIEKRKMEINSL